MGLSAAIAGLPNALRWLERLPKEHIRIFKALVTVAILVAMAKGVGAAKEMAVASRYGTGPIIDAYVFTLALVTWPVTAWVGVTTVTLIPTMIGLGGANARSADRFRREFIGVTLLIGVLFGVVTGAVLAFGAHAGLFGLARPVSSLVEAIAAPMSLLAPLGMIVGLLSSLLMASHRHTNSLLDGVPPLVIMIAVIAFPRGSGPIVLGSVAGVALQALASALVQPPQWRDVRPAFSMQSEHWPSFWKNFGVVLLGEILITATGVVDQLSVARLDASSNAVLSYANRLIALMTALGATAIARAALPVFAEVRAAGDGREWALSMRWAALLFGAGLAAAAAAWLLAPLGVRLLFQRGAFSAYDTKAVTQAVQFGLIQLPFYFSAITLAQIMAGTMNYRAFLQSNILAFTGKLACNILLTPVLGLRGVLIGTAVMYTISLAYLWSVASSGRRRALKAQRT